MLGVLITVLSLHTFAVSGVEVHTIVDDFTDIETVYLESRTMDGHTLLVACSKRSKYPVIGLYRDHYLGSAGNPVIIDVRWRGSGLDVVSSYEWRISTNQYTILPSAQVGYKFIQDLSKASTAIFRYRVGGALYTGALPLDGVWDTYIEHCDPHLAKTH